MTGSSRAASAAARRLQGVTYGWIVVAALSITETISWGIVYYGFPVFLRAMEQDLHASRVAVTGALSLALGVSALGAIPAGRWLDRYGPRALMTGGSLLAAVLLLLWARVESLPALYAVWCGLGLAMAAILYEPAFAAVVQWFRDGRDRALLTVTLAAGLASTIFMPIEAWLLVRVGWRAAVQILAVFLAATTIPLHALVLRRAPGQAEDGHAAAAAAGGADAFAEPAAIEDAGPAVRPDVSLGRALSDPVFWALQVAFAIGVFVSVALTVHLIPYLIQRGYAPQFAAVVVGWIGAMQLVGRLLFAPVAARLGPHQVNASIFVVQGAATALLATVTRMPWLAGVIVLTGAANGMATLARASTVAEIFGRRHYGSISGAIAVGSNGARALGPIGASLLILWLGGYTRMFLVLAVAVALGGAAVAAAGRARSGGPALARRG